MADVRSTDFSGSDLRLFLWDGTSYEWEMSEIRHYRFNEVSTALDESDRISSPIQIFPNPSNGEVTISFEFDHAAEVDIALFDLGGTLVAQLSKKHFRSGEHSITWNGADEKGELVANGTYVCRIMQGAQLASKLMLIER